jgi:hypothetical protein
MKMGRRNRESAGMSQVAAKQMVSIINKDVGIQ